MTLQLNQVLQDVFASLGIAQVRKITSTGTATTSIDTALAGDGTDEGTLIVVTDAAGAAPQGEFARITAFNTSTNAFTHDALTAATASGDYVMAVRNDLPLFDAIEVVNRALRKLGDLDYIDTTTLDSASNQTEYAAAVAWKRRRPTKIEIQTNTGDSDDNRPQIIYDWDYRPAAANSTGLIIFNSQPTSSRDLYIWYTDAHPRVATYSAYIDERFHPELVKQACLVEALEFMVSQTGRGVDPELVQHRNSAAVELDRARSMYPIYREPVRAKLLIVN